MQWFKWFMGLRAQLVIGFKCVSGSIGLGEKGFLDSNGLNGSKVQMVQGFFICSSAQLVKGFKWVNS